MRQYLFGVAAAMAVAVSSAPAAAYCGGCAPVVRYTSCVQPVSNPCAGYGYGGGWAYATVPAPVQYYAVQPQYYYVNQGPTYTGPGMFAPAVAYQARAVGGWSGYGAGQYSYSGGPYADPTHHYYHGMPAVSTPTVYSYRRAYRPAVRYGYRHMYAPRVYRGPRVWGPRVYAPRPSVRYGHRHYVAPRYSVAPGHYAPRQRMYRSYK
jgi:hypothetical protein